MLDSLNDQTLGPYQLKIARIGPPRFFDQFNFGIYLRDGRGNRTDAPVFRGLYNAGRPSIHVPAWIDGEFVEQTTDNRPQMADGGQPSVIVTIDMAEQLAQKLGALIPAGGRLWFAYEAYHGDGEIARETRAGLKANLPLLTTSIGFLLYRADCWLGLRDWHFPEGGREGPMKLQGNKALDREHARGRAREAIAELEMFVGQIGRVDNSPHALARARIILPALQAIAYG